MKKQVYTRIWILLLSLFIMGCSKPTNAGPIDALVENDQTSMLQAETEQLSRWEVMDRIVENYGLNNAQGYQNEIEDRTKDAIVLLCQSESGKYTAYGFISPEYGQTGILIDNIIDGESNWNYFDDYTWTYGDSKPALSEQGEYGVTFTYTQGNGPEQTIYYDTFDTGTMSVRK